MEYIPAPEREFMDFSTINWVGVVVAFVANFIAGAVWFGPKTFFPVWWKAMGKSPEEQPGNNSMGVVFGSTAVAAFVTTVVMALLVGATNTDSAASGAVLGLTVGVGFSAAQSLSHRLFGGHGFKVWAIEVGSDVLNVVIVGAILGAFH